MRRRRSLAFYLLSGASLVVGLVLAARAFTGSVHFRGFDEFGFNVGLVAENNWYLAGIVALILAGVVGLAATWWLSGESE
jgi:hypothetical protein